MPRRSSSCDRTAQAKKSGLIGKRRELGSMTMCHPSTLSADAIPLTVMMPLHIILPFANTEGRATGVQI